MRREKGQAKGKGSEVLPYLPTIIVGLVSTIIYWTI